MPGRPPSVSRRPREVIWISVSTSTEGALRHLFNRILSQLDRCLQEHTLFEEIAAFSTSSLEAEKARA